MTAAPSPRCPWPDCPLGDRCVHAAPTGPDPRTDAAVGK